MPKEYQKAILKHCYDSQVAVLWGRDRTQEIVARDLTWDGWMENVARHVESSPRWQKAKSNRHSKRMKLVPMPTGERPWEDIAMDFVGELPESEAYNAILVIADRFTTMQQFIPVKTTWMSEDLADAYLNHIWKLQALPKYITSDRGPQFPSTFLKVLNSCLNKGLRLSTAHHPQTDGLSERGIQTLKQCLRIFCHNRQN